MNQKSEDTKFLEKLKNLPVLSFKGKMRPNHALSKEMKEMILLSGF